MYMSKFIKPYRIGDEVKYVGKKHYLQGDQIIIEVDVRDVNEYEYGTTMGAWIDHNDLLLIRECNESSIKKLMEEDNDD